MKVIDEATKDDINNIIEKTKHNEEIVFYHSQLQDLNTDELQRLDCFLLSKFLYKFCTW